SSAVRGSAVRDSAVRDSAGRRTGSEFRVRTPNSPVPVHEPRTSNREPCTVNWNAEHRTRTKNARTTNPEPLIRRSLYRYHHKRRIVVQRTAAEAGDLVEDDVDERRGRHAASRRDEAGKPGLAEFLAVVVAGFDDPIREQHDTIARGKAHP